MAQKNSPAAVKVTYIAGLIGYENFSGSLRAYMIGYRQAANITLYTVVIQFVMKDVNY